MHTTQVVCLQAAVVDTRQVVCLQAAVVDTTQVVCLQAAVVDTRQVVCVCRLPLWILEKLCAFAGCCCGY